MSSKLILFLKKPLNLFLIAVIIFAGWGAFAYWRGLQPTAYELVKVVKGEIVQQVSVTGKVKPADSVELAFERSGKVASVVVGVGDKVTVGQRLATLSNADLVAQLAQAQASLDKEIVKLAELRSGTRPEELQIAQTTVTNAEKTLADVLSKAEIDLNNYYDDVKDILNDAYINADDAVNKQTDELFSNDDSADPQLSFYSSSGPSAVITGGGIGGGPLPPSDAYQKWLEQQAPPGEVKGASTGFVSDQPAGEVLGASTFKGAPLAGTGFSWPEFLGLLAVILILIGLRVILRKYNKKLVSEIDK